MAIEKPTELFTWALERIIQNDSVTGKDFHNKIPITEDQKTFGLRLKADVDRATINEAFFRIHQDIMYFDDRITSLLGTVGGVSTLPIPSYNVSTLPEASENKNRIVLVTDITVTNGIYLAGSNGTNWINLSTSQVIGGGSIIPPIDDGGGEE